MITVSRDHSFARGYAPIQIQDLLSATQARGGVVISGEQKSGKTVLASALTDHYAMDTISGERNKKVVVLDNETGIVPCGAVSNYSWVTTGLIAAHIDRMQPDAILFGEIRSQMDLMRMREADSFTDKFFATLQADSAVAAVKRLLDLESGRPDLPVSANIHQSLVPVQCKKCKGKYALKIVKKKKMVKGVKVPEAPDAGPTCDKCGDSGVSHFMPLTEILYIDKAMARAIAARNIGEVERIWIAAGGKTIADQINELSGSIVFAPAAG